MTMENQEVETEENGVAEEKKKTRKSKAVKEDNEIPQKTLMDEEEDFNINPEDLMMTEEPAVEDQAEPNNGEDSETLQENPTTTRKRKRSGLMPEELGYDENIVKAGQRKKRKIYNDGVVYTENGSVKINSANSKRREEYLNLVASQKSGNIQSGILIGARVTEHSFVLAEIAYGDYFTVCIPAHYLIDMSIQPKEIASRLSAEDERSTYLNLVNRRIGSEVSFIVLQVNEGASIAYASRLHAMAKKARAYFIKEQRDGIPFIQPEMKVEAKVVQVNSIGIWVETFGVETFIRQEELSWMIIADVKELYEIGQTVIIKILSREPHVIKAGEKTIKTVAISASIKQLEKNPNEVNFGRFEIGQNMLGKVTRVTDAGVFVILGNNKAVALCHYPSVGAIPTLYSEVLVKISDLQKEGFKVYGKIQHIIKKA